MTSMRDRAVALRRAGLSRAQIAAELGVRSQKVLNELLRGEPPPAWTARPRAKDELRAQAVALRQQGRSYREIAEVVPVSRSTLSLWLTDVPLTDEHRARLAHRKSRGQAKAADSLRARRQHREATIRSDARAEIGELTDRELFIAGIVAYWAEGSKAKPWNTSQRVTFVNSDEGMIRLFLAWLLLIGVPRERLRFNVSIHQTADVAAATAFWSAVTGVPASAFGKAWIKRHAPKTNRRNVDDAYHGCLAVTVARSTDLNRRIAGWWEGVGDGLPVPSSPSGVE